MLARHELDLRSFGHWDVLCLCISRESKIRALILLATIIPITIVANFIRVLSLVLIAYYGGVELIDGILHDLTGILLFVIALGLVFICDGILGLISAVVLHSGRSRRRNNNRLSELDDRWIE